MLHQLFCSWALLFTLIVVSSVASDYHERLTLQPLPLGSLLASFDFRSNESLSAFDQQNFRYFPRSLGQILQHTHTKELHLRFTSGRWIPETWGARPWHGAQEGGTGVELWAWIDSASDEETFDRWTSLTQLLSGLFCASLNFVDSTRSTRPEVTFEAGGYHVTNQSLQLLHGVLPGEVVCTENLTPFTKLLPCKGKSGISSLLDGHKVFDAAWQTMAIDIRPLCPVDRDECLIEIHQTLDMVLDIERSKRPPKDPIPRPIANEQLSCDHSKSYNSYDTCYPLPVSSRVPWSLHELFGREIVGACPLINDEGPNAMPVRLNVPHDQVALISGNAFESKSQDSGSQHRLYHLMPGQGFDVSMPEGVKDEDILLAFEPIHVERTITGHGAARGGIRAVFTNPSSTQAVNLVYFESLPWFMRPFVHTLTTDLGDYSGSWQVVKQMYYRPAIDRERGTQLELILSIPPSSTVTLTYDFEKAVLRYTEYPPDANRGFNVAPAVIRVLSNRDDVYLRTTSLLLPLPTPDFSMPYNVIILTSTVMALAFGSIYNILVRRFVGAEEVQGGKLGQIKDRIGSRMLALKSKVLGKTEKVE